MKSGVPRQRLAAHALRVTGNVEIAVTGKPKQVFLVHHRESQPRIIVRNLPMVEPVELSGKRLAVRQELENTFRSSFRNLAEFRQGQIAFDYQITHLEQISTHASGPWLCLQEMCQMRNESCGLQQTACTMGAILQHWRTCKILT